MLSNTKSIRGGQVHPFTVDNLLNPSLRQLEKFEVILLEPDQRKEFQMLYESGVREECSCNLYLSWLHLKLETEDTEEEILNTFFTDKTPSNIPKKKTSRQVRKPSGSARFDILSSDWREIWEEQQKEKEANEEKQKEIQRRKVERTEEKKRIEERKAEKEKEKERKKAAIVPRRGRRKITEPDTTLEEMFANKRRKK